MSRSDKTDTADLSQQTSNPDKQVGEILIQPDELTDRVKSLAAQINIDYRGKELMLIAVLKGALFFVADLMRYLEISTQVDFMAVASYGSSTGSSGVVRILKDLDASIEAQHVLIVEDIIDSGLTLNYLLRSLKARNPASLEVCALLTKPERRKVEIPVKYVGFEIPNRFVVGYGLDYNQQHRQLPYISALNHS